MLATAPQAEVAAYIDAHADTPSSVMPTVVGWWCGSARMRRRR